MSVVAPPSGGGGDSSHKKIVVNLDLFHPSVVSGKKGGSGGTRRNKKNNSGDDSSGTTTSRLKNQSAAAHKTQILNRLRGKAALAPSAEETTFSEFQEARDFFEAPAPAAASSLSQLPTLGASLRAAYGSSMGLLSSSTTAPAAVIPVTTTAANPPLTNLPANLFGIRTAVDENRNPCFGCLKNGELPTYKKYTQKNRHVMTGGGTPEGGGGGGGGGVQIRPENNVYHEYQPHGSIGEIPSSPPPAPVSPSPVSINLNVGGAMSLNNSLSSPEINLGAATAAMSPTDLANTPPNILFPGSDPTEKEVLSGDNVSNATAPSVAMGGGGRRTIRRISRVKLGKDKQQNRVSVLIPNHTMRKRVLKETQTFSTTSMDEIRSFLQKKGLIKVGCSAPDNVLRKMYESARMIGADIINHNKDTLLYNYLNGETSSTVSKK